MSPHRFASLLRSKTKQWGRINPAECLKIIEENFQAYYEAGQFQLLLH